MNYLCCYCLTDCQSSGTLVITKTGLTPPPPPHWNPDGEFLLVSERETIEILVITRFFYNPVYHTGTLMEFLLVSERETMETLVITRN